MIYDYDDLPPPTEGSNVKIPDTEGEIQAAKMFMQQSSSLTGDNLYDHLTEVLNKILTERPENVIDFFEEYSRKVKEKRFQPKNDHLEDMYVESREYTTATKIMPLFREPKEQEEELADMTTNNMLQLSYYFEQSGVGLPRDETFALLLSICKLIRHEPISSIRFWGKICGLYKNYFILETELKEEEYFRRNELFSEMQTDLLTETGIAGLMTTTGDSEDEGEGDTGRKLPPLPLPIHEVPLEPPQEMSGVGANKKVYYVCNEIGESWSQLPDVTPEQIRVARQIKKSFTGYLTQEIVTYPRFPGNEANYLRAQIGRISGGTHISPLGFYTFKGGGGGEEEEEEAEDEEAEGGAPKTSLFENKRFELPPLQDLIDSSMSFWVHHVQYILPQGRTSWWNPAPVAEVDEEMGEEEGDQPAVAGPEPEVGPPLLTPLSEDASLEAIPPWSVKASSTLFPEYSLAIVRSNLWPGAYCFTTYGKFFQNVYIGHGHKFMSNNFSPVPLPFVRQDYPLGPEIMEMTDPSGAQEEQWRIDHLPKPEPLAGEGEEVEEEEEEEF